MKRRIVLARRFIKALRLPGGDQQPVAVLAAQFVVEAVAMPRLLEAVDPFAGRSRTRCGGRPGTLRTVYRGR